MDEDLPSRVDLVVVGTGMGECLLAASASRSGLSVLHLDDNKFYGGEWASFSLHALSEWKESVREAAAESVADPIDVDWKSLENEGETLKSCRRKCRTHIIRDEYTVFSEEMKNGKRDAEEKAKEESVGKEGEEENGGTEEAVREQEEKEGGKEKESKKEKESTPITWREHIEKMARKFSIDLVPKVLLSRGDMVQTLVDSSASKYGEFKLADRLLGVSDGELFAVPCSKNEIFDSDDLSMKDKRRLMKFLQFCLQWHNDPEANHSWKEFEDQPFHRFIESNGLTGKVAVLVEHCLSILCPPSRTPVLTVPALRATCQFFDSVGRFGPSPFLVPLYGSGELPQCFARLSAVFGGIFYIGRRLQGLVEKDGRVQAVIVNGKRIEADHFAMSSSYVPGEYMVGKSDRIREEDHRIFRAALITTGSIREDGKERITVVNLRGLTPSSSSTRLYEVGFSGCVAPRELFLMHLTARAGKDADRTVDDVIEKFYSQEGGPRVIRRIQWEQETDEFRRQGSVRGLLNEKAPVNLAALSVPDSTLNYDSILKETQKVFAEFWPERDFLPKKLEQEEEEEENEELDKVVHSTLEGLELGSHLDREFQMNRSFARKFNQEVENLE